jgi:hypothetical protein
MEHKISPAPWTLEIEPVQYSPTDTHQFGWIWAEGCKEISGSEAILNETDLYNVVLMAAAPDLFDACAKVLAYIDENGVGSYPGDKLAMDVLRSAMYKAMPTLEQIATVATYAQSPTSHKLED